MTLFERLKAESAEELEKFARLPLIGALVSGTVGRERYKGFLNDLYHVVWHFCPAMAAAAARCSDSFASTRYFYYEHIEEEKGHEIWVLEDCEAVGGADFVQAVKSGRPCKEVQGLIGFNYSISEREHPCGVLGMVYVLEAIASRLAGRAGMGVAKALNLQLDPPVGVKFLSTHGPMDAGHLDELEKVMAGIKDERTADVVSNACRVNFHLFSAAFN
jgi:pyrroloquinoline quinone (PQQ) biosynthesis protein C